MKPPPKKPANPFGTFIFGRDGSVRPNIQTLSHVKEEQERKVGELFAEKLAKSGRVARFVEQLPESDHDFVLDVDGLRTVVQAAEVNDFRFLVPMSMEEYNGKNRFKEYVFETADKVLGVDVAARNEAVANVIAGKLKKSYQPLTKEPLWLLVWTTGMIFGPIALVEGPMKLSPPFGRVVELLKNVGVGPFSEIWFFNLAMLPARIDVGLDAIPVALDSPNTTISFGVSNVEIVRKPGRA